MANCQESSTTMQQNIDNTYSPEEAVRNILNTPANDAERAIVEMQLGKVPAWYGGSWCALCLWQAACCYHEAMLGRRYAIPNNLLFDES